MKHLTPSLPNLVGALAGLLFIISDGILSHRDYGAHRILNDTTVSIAAATGFDAFTVAMIIGGAIVLVISFVVSHMIEILKGK